MESQAVDQWALSVGQGADLVVFADRDGVHSAHVGVHSSSVLVTAVLSLLRKMPLSHWVTDIPQEKKKRGISTFFA